VWHAIFGVTMDAHPNKHNVDEIVSPDTKNEGRKGLKSTNESESFRCLMCSEDVLHWAISDDSDDDDSIFCEGDCDSWVHRRCIGLS